jgi:DNA mismatch endonuclease, patch repair protein
MAHIRSKNTKPERIVRSLLHRMGYRFRLYRRDLPGCPDIVMPKYKAVVFVHGCFWHQHKRCRDGVAPKTKQKYWRPKLIGNVQRDKEHVQSLREMGWRVVVIWECEAERKLDMVAKKLNAVLLET